MSMVINTNVQATRTHGVYSRNNAFMNEAMNRVATGMKINSAKDNASTWAITQRMRDRIRANDQANQNVQNDSALIRTAQGGIENTVSILTTLKERAINAANDSNVNLDREAIAAEIKQLTQQIDDNATKVKFNGRYLLNGAADGTTTTETDTTDTTEAAEDTSAITEPTAATLGSTEATHSVYKLLGSGLKYYGGSNKVSTGASDTTTLTDLLKTDIGNDSSITADQQAAAKAFKVGDTVTFSWKEDGEEKSYSYEVTASSKVSNLAFSKDHLQVKWIATNTDITGQETGTIKKSDGTSVDKNAVLKNSDETAVKTASSNGQGLYAVGDRGVEITDFKVSVTYKDIINENRTTTRTNGQDIIAFTGETKTVAAAGDPTGSAEVFKIAGLKSGASAAAATTTAMKDLMINVSGTDTKVITSGDDTDIVTFTAGDVSVDVRGDSTIKDLQDVFARKGISVVLATAAGTSLQDTDSNYVKDDATNANYQTEAPGTNKADLYFFGKSGEKLDSVTVSAKDANGNTRAVINDFKEATQVLSIAEEEAAEETTEETSTEPLTIGPSTPLAFHIGGEQDFAIDVTIDKMTVDNLFAQKDEEGNITKIFDDSTFSDLFKTKDGAKEALGIIDTALNKALAEQTKLGAVEARLGYTSDNLTTMNENLEAANSAYRDSDIAKEMTNYMKYAVLSQASQYMLAQAGQNAYQILNLLNA